MISKFTNAKVKLDIMSPIESSNSEVLIWFDDKLIILHTKVFVFFNTWKFSWSKNNPDIFLNICPEVFLIEWLLDLKLFLF
jgi:hypothetical protein